MKSIRYIGHPLGVILLAFGVALLVPLGLSIFERDGEALSFAAGAAVALALAALLLVIFRGYRRELKVRDGFLLVACVWILLPVIAALPLLLSIDGLSAANAYFEAVSGFTASGPTVLTGLDTLPRSLNLWRHELQWLGGIGILILSAAVLPWLGIGAVRLARSDQAYRTDDSRIGPAIRHALGPLCATYGFLTLACVALLELAGMGWFDAVCHAFSAVSLGGFSSHDANIRYFDSPLIEGVLELFMLLAGINFLTHFMVWKRRSLRPYWRDIEVPAYLAAILFSAVALSLYLWGHRDFKAFGPALRRVSFEVISFATDSGFTAYDSGRWPLFAGLWMLLLSCICVCSGSPGGGLRMIRTLILFRQSGREISGLLHPSSVRALKVGGQPIDDRAVSAVLGFVHLYTIGVIGLSFLLILSGMDFLTAFSTIIATFNNTAHGLAGGALGHHFQSLSNFQIWVCSLSMLLGRLDIFVLLVPLTRAFWRG